MHWEWVVPVIALVLWILNNLIRNAADDKARAAQRPQADGQRPADRPSSDVEQFLEEINRMRRQNAPERREEEPGPQRSQPEEYRVTEPRRIEPPRPVAMPEAAPQRPRRPAQKPRTAVAKQAVARPAAEILDVIPVAAPVAPVRPVAASVRRPQTSPAVVQLWSMLRNPGSVQAAIMLHEVIGPPRCRRG